MIKPKLNEPDVEQTTTIPTINVFEQGMPPTIVSDEYPAKNYSLKEQTEIVNQPWLRKPHQWPVNEIWACRNCKTRGQTFSSQTLHYCPHCGIYWGD